MWRRGKRSPFFSSQTRSVVPFAGRLLRWAWLRGSSPSSLTAGTRVSSGRLVRGSPWPDATTGCGKRSLLRSAAFPVLSSRHRLCLCFRACLERVGESFGERGWRECITLYNCIRLTPIFRTVLNYSTTGSHSRCSTGVLWNAGNCSHGVPTYIINILMRNMTECLFSISLHSLCIKGLRIITMHRIKKIENNQL